MINTLRFRIAILATLVAMLSSSVSAIVGVRSVRQGAIEQKVQTARRGIEDLQEQLRQMVVDLAGEAEEYAFWDELYAQMPRPKPEWTSINLQPGKNRSGLVQVYALVAGQQLVGRYRSGSQSYLEPRLGDTATKEALIALSTRHSAEGLATFDGHPALWATRPIRRSDASGTQPGVLLALAYFTPAEIQRLRVCGWEIAISSVKESATGETTVNVSGGHIEASVVVPAVDGGLLLTIREQGSEGELIAVRANREIIGAGIITAILATLVGVVLGWHWLRPISDLAAACRRRVVNSAYPIPQDFELTEARILAVSLGELVKNEREQRLQIAETLARETTTNAVHKRFLAQLGQEMGGPIRQLIRVVELLGTHDGHLAPDEVASARNLAELLEERFHEVLGLAAESTSEAGGTERDFGEYAAGVRELLRPIAARRNVNLQVVVPVGRVVIDGRLLTPILVNLVVNAIAASPSEHVTLTCQAEKDGMSWTISDTGSGMSLAIATSVTEACLRGEVLPGTPGIGLGLVLVLANVRALNGKLTLVHTGPGGTTFTLYLPPLRYGSGLFPARREPT